MTSASTHRQQVTAPAPGSGWDGERPVASSPFRSGRGRVNARWMFKRIEPFVPPVLAEWLRLLFSDFRYAGREWPPTTGRAAGWGDASVAAAQERHWALLSQNLAGSGPLGVSHLPGHESREDASDHNIVMSFAYVLALASRGRESVSMLDWGGGCGHYLRYAEALYPELEVDYHCFDLPHLCELGRRLLPEAVFHDDAAGLQGRSFDFVIASSSLHYFEDWRATLRELAGWTGKHLYIARLQTVLREKSFVAVQRPHSMGYLTEYPGWFINRDELLATAGDLGLELVREFVFEEKWYVRGAPEQGCSRGFLFRRS